MADLIQRKVLGNFTVYTKEEADELGLIYYNWWEAEPNQYCISDDGYVSLCIKSKRYLRSKNDRPKEREKVWSKFVTLAYGRFWYKVFPSGHVTKTPCVYEERRGLTDCYGLTKAQTWEQYYRKMARFSYFAKIYAKMMVTNNFDWNHLGRIIRKNTKNPELLAKKTLKTKGVIKMVEEEIKSLYKKYGIDEEYVLQNMKKAMEIATDQEDAKTMFLGLKQMREMLGMSANKIETTKQLELNQTKLLEDRITMEEKLLTVTETTTESEK